MDFYKIALYGIVMMVLALSILFIMVVSAPLDIWFPSLDPNALWLQIWGYCMMGLGIAVAVFMVLVWAAFLVYLIIRGIPLIGPGIADSIPLFNDLNRSGLFPLISGMGNALAHGEGFFGTLWAVFNVWVTFLFDSVPFVQSVLGDDEQVAQQPRNPASPPMDLPDAAPETEENMLTEAERHAVANSYNQCLRENMVVVTAQDSNIERASKQVQNKGFKMMCSMLRMATYLRTLMAQRRLFQD